MVASDFRSLLTGICDLSVKKRGRYFYVEKTNPLYKSFKKTGTDQEQYLSELKTLMQENANVQVNF